MRPGLSGLASMDPMCKTVSAHAAQRAGEVAPRVRGMRTVRPRRPEGHNRIYRIFISHRYAWSSEYFRLVRMLDAAEKSYRGWRWVNCSVPQDAPIMTADEATALPGGATVRWNTRSIIAAVLRHARTGHTKKRKGAPVPPARHRR